MKKFNTVLLLPFLIGCSRLLSMDMDQEKKVQLPVNDLRKSQNGNEEIKINPEPTPRKQINQPPKEKACKFVQGVSLRGKVAKLFARGYLSPQGDYTFDQRVREVLEQLPIEEVFHDVFLEKQEDVTPIEQQILKLAQDLKLKTMNIGENVDLEQIIISSSSSSSSHSPNYSPEKISPMYQTSTFDEYIATSLSDSFQNNLLINNELAQERSDQDHELLFEMDELSQ